jgi:exonuclease III
MASILKILSWNVRGLNGAARQEVRQVCFSMNPGIICLQKTKLSSISPSLIRSMLGPQYENNFMYLPVDAQKGAS